MEVNPNDFFVYGLSTSPNGKHGIGNEFGQRVSFGLTGVRFGTPTPPASNYLLARTGENVVTRAGDKVVWR